MLINESTIRVVEEGRVSPFWEFAVDEIVINRRLPFSVGKSSLIFQFQPLHNSKMGLTRDFREDPFY